jgi:hypothetical protein
MLTSGSGAYQYTVVEGWEQLPEGWKHADCAGVAADAEDRVYLYTRRLRSQARFALVEKAGRPLSIGVGAT